MSETFLAPGIRDTIRARLGDASIVYCEVGARKGGSRFQRLGELVHYYGFEPDVEQAERLKERLTGLRRFGGVSVFSHAIMGTSGRVAINVLRHRGCSSVLTPNAELVSQYSARRGENHWPEHFQIVGRYECDALSLDDFARRAGVARIDFLGLDTQGTEYEILQGGRQIVGRSTSVIHVEMETVPLYRDQRLLADVVDHLYGLGFRLIKLENPQYISRAPAEGQEDADTGELVSVDGIFCRHVDERFLKDVGADGASIARHMLVLYELGFRTLAIQAGRRFQSVVEKPEEWIDALIDAMVRSYHADSFRARPRPSQFREIVRRWVPMTLRRKVRAVLTSHR